MDIRVEDLEWFEYNPSMLYGRDKDGNEYIIGHYGEIRPVRKGRITPYMHGTDIVAVKQLIENGKKRAAKVA